MSAIMSNNEKDMSKLIRESFRKSEYNNIFNDFVEKSKKGELYIGSRVVLYDDAINYCKNKNIEGNDFKKILCYAIKKMGANDTSVGTWFNETSALGNNIRYFVVKYFKDNVVGE